uniref:Smr domain-containing protein n=1 Tax=Strongyloides papillosus TaxID=174720 RepID=A0A0N5C631_STREA
MEVIYSEALKKDHLKSPEELPDLNRLQLILKRLFYYNERIKSTNNAYNVEKLEASINEIFKRAKLRQPIEILSNINEKSNGLFVNTQDDKKTYVFAIGTTPIVLSENLEVTIKNWLMFNLLSPSFKMNEPFNRLYELLITITGGRGNHTTKGRAGKCVHVDQLINDIKNKGFETY